jgi:hypothetical protein
MGMTRVNQAGKHLPLNGINIKIANLNNTDSAKIIDVNSGPLSNKALSKISNQIKSGEKLLPSDYNRIVAIAFSSSDDKLVAEALNVIENASSSPANSLTTTQGKNLSRNLFDFVTNNSANEKNKVQAYRLYIKVGKEIQNITLPGEQAQLMTIVVDDSHLSSDGQAPKEISLRSEILQSFINEDIGLSIQEHDKISLFNLGESISDTTFSIMIKLSLQNTNNNKINTPISS